MNILFVNDSPFNPIVGGLERVTDVLTKELQKRGHSVFYLCAKIDPSKSNLLDYDYPAPLYQLPEYGLFDNTQNSAYYTALQRSLDIDVVINQRGLGGWFNSLLPITQVKLISVIHSIPDAGILLFLNKLIANTVPPFQKIKHILKRLLSPFFQLYWKRKVIAEYKVRYQQLAHYSDAIVTLSRKDAELLNRMIEEPFNAQIASIPNPNSFSPIGDILPRMKKKEVLYVGRLTKGEKEPLRLLKIWELLHQTHSDWQLKIVGDGSEKSAMERYAEIKQLKNVSFEGQQSNVAKYYNEAAFICLTSNFEGWGMVLTEGMQYGCIPFTFNNYGAAFEIIDDGVNGCLIPAFDIQKYANRLSELILDNSTRIQMSAAAMEKVQKFSVKNVANRWEELFQQI